MNRFKPMAVFLLCTGVILGGGSCVSLQKWTPMGSQSQDLLATGLVGWQQIEGRQGSWAFANGVLSAQEGGEGWLSTVRQYENFELSLEFKVSAGANSGVFLRTPQTGDPAYVGMEVQILDDYAKQWENLRPNQYTGSIYDVQAPAERGSKKAGQWQKMVIVCHGSVVKVSLNGKEIIDTDTTYYPYRYDAHPGLQRTRGYIGLQNHGSRVRFRNIQIKML